MINNLIKQWENKHKIPLEKHHKPKLFILIEEDILHLKNALEYFFETKADPMVYVEMFTIKSIIEQYESANEIEVN